LEQLLGLILLIPYVPCFNGNKYIHGGQWGV
jgi:hypothetical protein